MRRSIILSLPPQLVFPRYKFDEVCKMLVRQRLTRMEHRRLLVLQTLENYS
jgi:hypothetical protein